MTRAVHVLNVGVTAVFAFVCRPLEALDPLWALAAISLATGVLMVWVFGKVSNQTAIREIRDRLRGHLLGVRLYRHDVGVTLRLQGLIFRDTGAYLKLALVPVLVLVVPVVFIMAQLDLRLAVRPLAEGESMVVTALVRDAAAFDGPIIALAEQGLAIETPAIRVASTREVAWRVRASVPGRHALTIRIGDDTVETTVAVQPGWSAVPRRRSGRGVLDLLVSPGAPPIPAGSVVEAIELGYPALGLRLFGWDVHWLAGFFLLSLVSGYALKGPLRVEL